MPLTPNEMNEIARRVAEMLRPVQKRLDTHSGEMKAVRLAVKEEVSPAVAKKISDSQHEIEDRSVGFERLVLDSLTAQRQETAELAAIVKSIPPAALGAERAALRSEGKTDAVQVAADRADKHSLAAKVKANQALIVVIVTALAQGIWQAYQAIAHAVSP